MEPMKPDLRHLPRDGTIHRLMNYIMGLETGAGFVLIGYKNFQYGFILLFLAFITFLIATYNERRG